MEAGPDKDHNESGGKNIGPSHDLLHIGWIVLRIPGPKVTECANMTEFLNGF